MNNKIIAIIFARFDSSRLPGKALIEVNNEPILGYVINRAKKIKNIEHVVLATTDREIDNPLVEFAQKRGVLVFRGDLQNVAKRALDCANDFKADYFIRLNGDSPFLDFDLISKSMENIANFDFITNLKPRTFPYGIAVEIIKTKFFEKHFALFGPKEKEHIFSYFYNDKVEMRAKYITAESDNQDVILTIDELKDLEKFEMINSQIGIDINNMGYKELIENYLKFNKS